MNQYDIDTEESILILDDNPDDLRILISILEEQFSNIRPFAKSKEAMQSIIYAPPSLILLDILMPNVDGYDFCIQLKQNEHLSTIPIIFASGLQDIPSKVRGLSVGAVDFITKPYQHDEVRMRVSIHLQIHRMRQQLQAQNEQLLQEVATRQQVEAKLRESQRFMDLVTANIPLVMYVYDLSLHQMVYRNRHIDLLFDGLFATQRNAPQTVFPEDRSTVQYHIQQLTSAPDDVVLECTYRIWQPDGTWLWLTHYDMVFNRTAEGLPCQIIGAALDVTKQQRTAEVFHAQQQTLTILQERERLSRELHDTVGQMLSTIKIQSQTAYDLLNAGDILHAKSLLHTLTTITGEAQMDIQDFIIGATTSQRLFTSTGDTGTPFVAIVREHCAGLAHTYGFTISLQVDESLEQLEFASNRMIHLLRVVQEALTNVRKHAHVASARVHMTQHNHLLHIQIADEGSGFEVGLPPHQNTSQTAQSLSSYGLHSMRGRMEEIGGTFHIESAPGHGTTVTLTLPLQLPPFVPSLGLRLLLVDDNVLFLESFVAMLASRGCEIVGKATNGKTAIELALTTKPDIILMDIGMPDMDGITATHHISAIEPDIPIVMLTVAADDESLFAAIQAGASGYLVKGIGIQELLVQLINIKQGDVPLSPGLATRILREFAHLASSSQTETDTTASLTKKQRQVLKLVAQGLTYQEVAENLNYSEPTIRYHMKQILKRLHLKNRAEAVSYAKQHL